VVDGTIGGTSASVRGGQAFGSNITATATVNGKYLNQICGLEIDVALQAGSSAWSKGGITVNLQNADAVESANPSAAYTVGLTSDSPGSPGWTYGFVFGSGGSWWPINTTTGILIYADPNPFPGGRGLQAKSGIDFSAVAFIDSAYKSTGFRVDGTGHLTSIGLGFGSTAVSTATDLSKHIDLYGGVAGINVQSGGLTNYNALGGGAHMFNVGGTAIAYIGGSGIQSASGGLHFGAQGAATYNDFTKHIEIYNGSGFTVTGAGLNYVISNAHNFYTGSSNRFIITTTGLGFNGTAAVAKPTGVPVTIAAVHAALVSYGLIAP
jgi:hypothetical protein